MSTSSSEVYNLIALSGLLLAKVAVLFLVVYYCCKRRAARLLVATADSADQTDQAAHDVVHGSTPYDQPPSYSKVVLKVDPPGYLDSIVNADINPEMNKSWASDLACGAVSPEVAEIIARSRQNSLVPPAEPVPVAQTHTSRLQGLVLLPPPMAASVNVAWYGV